MKTEHFQASSFNVFPNDLNFGNSLFGGKVMSEIDCEMAKVARSIIWGTDANNVVTRKMEVDFIAPAHQADWIMMEADVYELGRSSMKIMIDVYIWKGPDRKNWIKICSAKAVFVALKDGAPYPHGKTM